MSSYSLPPFPCAATTAAAATAGVFYSSSSSFIFRLFLFIVITGTCRSAHRTRNTFAQEEDDPLIVVITAASILQTDEEDGSLVLEYDIEQLGSHDEVSSIKEFVGLDRQHCSIFVDDFNDSENCFPPFCD